MNTAFDKLFSGDTRDSTDLMPFSDLKNLPEITICTKEPPSDDNRKWLAENGYHQNIKRFF